MQTSNLPDTLLDTLTQHVPPEAAWVPVACTVTAGLVGLVFLAKGAKLAPVLAAIAFTGLGGFAGALLPCWTNTPLWPTVAATAVLGLVLGVVLFRVWFALLVAGCLIAGSLGLYSTHVLQRPLSDYFSRGYDNQEELVTLLEPGEAIAENRTWQDELDGLWTYLGESVPHFHGNFAAIVITTGLAGLIFALLLPKTARAFWAATVGTGLFVPAAYGLLHAYWPPGAAWLSQWGLVVAALLWGGSLVYNLADMTERRPKKPAADSAGPA